MISTSLSPLNKKLYTRLLSFRHPLSTQSLSLWSKQEESAVPASSCLRSQPVSVIYSSSSIKYLHSEDKKPILPEEPASSEHFSIVRLQWLYFIAARVHIKDHRYLKLNDQEQIGEVILIEADHLAHAEIEDFCLFLAFKGDMPEFGLLADCVDRVSVVTYFDYGLL